MSDPSAERAAEAFHDARNAVFRGDTGPMSAAWSRAADITYMRPFGEILVGWAPIADSWAAQARAITSGDVRPEGLRVVTDGTLAVAVGFERGSCVVEGREVRVDIRATSTHRREDGAWKMIGHHTDPIA